MIDRNFVTNAESLLFGRSLPSAASSTNNMTPEHDLVVQLSAWNDLQRTVEAISREDAKVRMHLGQEWWADLDKQQALQYINRKQRGPWAP